jgi:succinoglycan biosynthesis transport protein ExoP
MAGPIDAFRYISYLRSRWRLIAASCGIALTLAALASMLLPRQYTATARIVIEAPAGSDLRAAMAVSPIYLESLRTYEHFAGSDTLFRKAVDGLDLRRDFGARAVESIKNRVLKVTLVRNTRILEIAATLPNAVKAQALARFLAESTVELNRSVVNEGDQDLIQGLEQQQGEARGRLENLEAQWARLVATEPVEDLKSSMENASELRAKLQQDILNMQVAVADAAEREHEPGAQATQLRADSANAQARITELRRQLQGLDRQAAEREKTLGQRLADRDKLEAERKTAQTSLTALEGRLREARGDRGYRGERLKIIDPGIVPERPSSPNVPLNLAAALLLGLVLPILYLAIELNFQEQRAIGRLDRFHTVAKGRDD